MNPKRIRSLNWDDEEKKIFLSVIREQAQFIESKALDTNSIRLKNKAWEEVHRKFNVLNRRNRQLKQLKIQWKRMKVNQKKLSNIRSSLKCGGERPTIADVEVIEIKDFFNNTEQLDDHNMHESEGIDKTDYVKNMLSHNITIKDIEHKRRMEMSEEEHAIKMEIHKEKLKCAILEREILEIKKVSAMKD